MLAALLAMAPPALAEVLVGRGDTLHVAIAEAPALSGDSKVDADGKIILPELGGIAVAGLDLDAVRARIEAELVRHNILKKPAVLVEIAKYRPVYVGGTVKRPGAVEYEPGLTVRHVLILAGGPGRADDARLASVDVASLRARWRTDSYQLLQVNSGIARLEAELTRNQHAEPSTTPSAVPGKAAEALASLDQAILDDRLKEWAGDQKHLREAMALFDLEIDVLEQQAELQKKELGLDKQQIAAARTLVEKGLMRLPRLQELQHAESRASRDLLDNQAFTARARQNRVTTEYELNSADTKWRIEINRQLRAAMLERVRLKAELDALSEQIVNAGLAISEADRETLQPVVAIYRTVAGRQKTIKAQMNTEVMPGDILDVSLSKGASG